MFDAALDTRPEDGARQLPLITPDNEWLRASLLVCAWLCARRDPNKARQFLTAQAEALQPDALAGTLELLHGRAVAAIEKSDLPPPRLPYFPGALPQKVPREVARAIVARIEGTTDAESITAALPSMIAPTADRAQHGDETPTYVAEGDNPWLVGYAINHPGKASTLSSST